MRERERWEKSRAGSHHNVAYNKEGAHLVPKPICILSHCFESSPLCRLQAVRLFEVLLLLLFLNIKNAIEITVTAACLSANAPLTRPPSLLAFFSPSHSTTPFNIIIMRKRTLWLCNSDSGHSAVCCLFYFIIFCYIVNRNKSFALKSGSLDGWMVGHTVASWHGPLFIHFQEMRERGDSTALVL